MTMKRPISKHSHTYSPLEHRMMLSADLDGARNLVVDGNFEDLDSSAFIAFSDNDDNNAQDIRFRSLNTSFSRIVELDSGAGRIDSLAQDLVLEEGAEYLISFDLRSRNSLLDDASDSNDVEVLFGGESVGTFSGLRRWQTVNIAITAESADNRLEFRELSTSSDGRGILLDHIGIAQVQEVDVINGSFEEVESDGLVTAAEVPGLFAIPNLDLIPVGVENIGSEAADGNNVLTINTSDVRLDRVFQNIDTEAGANYFVSFELRNTDSNNLDNSLRVRWNNDFAASLQGDSDWQTFGIVLGADSDTSTLLFRENNTDTGEGLQIDNVRIFKIGSLASDYSLDLNGDLDGTNNVLPFVENVERRLTNDAVSLQFSNGNLLTSATVRVLDAQGTEELSANTAGTNIEANFNADTGILRLVGRDSVENYQSVLQTLRYNDSSDTPPAERELVVSVTDGTVGSDRAQIRLNVEAVNDLPVVTQPDPITASIGQTVSIPIQATDPEMQDLDFVFSEFQGDTEVFGLDFDSGSGISNPRITDDGNLEFTTFAFGSSTISIAVTDPAAEEEVIVDFEVNVPFTEPNQALPDDFEAFSGQRQLSNVTPSLRNQLYDAAPELTIDTSLDYQAVIETSDGIIRFDLFESESPLTVNNFVNLAEDGFYDGLVFHRVIDNFVAQGGDPTGIGSGGPGYTFVDELDNGLEFSGFGQLAMANSGPNTNGSQFFFTLNDNPAFAGEHTIFGDVIAGEDVLRAVNVTGQGNAPQVIQRVTIEIV